MVIGSVLWLCTIIIMSLKINTRNQRQVTYACARSWHVYACQCTLCTDWRAWRQQTLIHNETWNDNLLIKIDWSMCHLCFSFISYVHPFIHSSSICARTIEHWNGAAAILAFIRTMCDIETKTIEYACKRTLSFWNSMQRQTFSTCSRTLASLWDAVHSVHTERNSSISLRLTTIIFQCDNLRSGSKKWMGNVCVKW